MDDSFGKFIAISYKFSRSYFNTFLKGLEVSGGPLQMLPAIHRFNDFSQDELSAKLNLDKTTVARGLGKLLKAGFIIKNQDENDKRVYRISLSEKGKEILPIILDARKKWSEILCSGFSEEEATQAKEFLARIAENASNFREIMNIL